MAGMDAFDCCASRSLTQRQSLVLRYLAQRLELIHMGGGAAAREQLDSLQVGVCRLHQALANTPLANLRPRDMCPWVCNLQARLRQGALLFQPSICKPRCSTQRELDYLEEVGIQVVDWNSLKTQGRRANNSSGMALQHFSRPAARAVSGVR